MKAAGEQARAIAALVASLLVAVHASANPGEELVGAVGTAADRAPVALARAVVGAAETITVARGDSLTSLAARFGLDAPELARANDLDARARLPLGRTLRVERAHVVPADFDALPHDALLVNVPQRMLFERRADTLVAAYPVAAGRATWRTPIGRFAIGRRAIDKPWIVPKRIQAEMRRTGQRVESVVPPGPRNPLGRHWLGVARSAIGIHGTNAPASVYSLRTHGCIRLHPDDIAALFERTSIGDPVAIVYEPVLLAELPDGRLCLEAHPDPYHREEAPGAVLDRLVEEAGLESRIDRDRAAAVVAQRKGLAYDVTRGRPGGLCLPARRLDGPSARALERGKAVATRDRITCGSAESRDARC